jgi:hypothetical protein
MGDLDTEIKPFPGNMTLLTPWPFAVLLSVGLDRYYNVQRPGIAIGVQVVPFLP